MFKPAYIDLFNKGILRERAEEALRRLSDCRICPRHCGVNRRADEKGRCGAGKDLEVASFGAHFGEERPLVGRNGSGTIFFAHCNLKCSFCQNYDISHPGDRAPAAPDNVAKIMLALQQQGCHNINFVTPTHYVPQILAALLPAAEGGLRVPLVYNTGGYDSVETLRLLDGVVDIYMPDLKFMDSDPAGRYMEAPDYPAVVKAAIEEMHRQAGDLRLDGEGVAQRGLLVRHLVFPGGLANTREAMRFLATRISRDTYVNVMNQYHPCGTITRRDPAGRAPSRQEFREAIQAAMEEGITRLDERKLFFL
jgi:putative pyruvate formate lyase activating enzyme